MEQSIAAVGIDPDEADECRLHLFGFLADLDELESVLLWPNAVAEAETALEHAKKVAQSWGTPEQCQRISGLEDTVREARAAADVQVLNKTREDVRGFVAEILWKRPVGFSDWPHSMPKPRA